MSIKSPEKSREQRAELTKQAIADIVRARIVVAFVRRPLSAPAASAGRTFAHWFVARSRRPYLSSWS